MKRWLLSLVSALLLVALIVGLVPVHGAWDDNLIFIALGDQPMALSADNMPIIVSNTVYVPYTLFDSNQNGGVNMGVYYGGMNQQLNTITFYDKSSNNLVLDLNTGLSYDYYPDGEVQRPRAIIRNGRIYISASSFCNYFGDYLHYFYTTTKYDYPLVRIYGNQAQLSDQDFMNSANPSALFNILSTYYASLNPQVTPTPTPTPTPTYVVPPTPALPVPDDTTQEDPLPILVTYLAIRCDGQGDTQGILDVLEGSGYSATLFFSPAQLVQEDDLIRRALAQGHIVGLIADGEEALDQLAYGNDLLSHIAYTSTRIALPEDGSGLSGTLTDADWLCWQTTLDGRGLSSSNLTTTLAARTSPQWILLDNSDAGQYSLSRLLSTLNDERYHYRVAVESAY